MSNTKTKVPFLSFFQTHTNNHFYKKLLTSTISTRSLELSRLVVLKRSEKPFQSMHGGILFRDFDKVAGFCLLLCLKYALLRKFSIEFPENFRAATFKNPGRLLLSCCATVF